ncbi:MAG: L-erythro-3,5-diaminohexanoate dehydrogenase [Ornithinimicrobium sp.]
MPPSSPLGLHRVLDRPGGMLPQAARRLDASAELLADDEVRIDVEVLHLDAASYRQLCLVHTDAASERLDGLALRQAVLEIVAERGKMQNPVTGSGGMLIGRVAEVGPASALGLHVGQPVATLVSLSLTPLWLSDGLVRWDGRSATVPAAGHAILFGRSVAAALPADLPPEVALMVMDVCGAPALVQRLVARHHSQTGRMPRVCVLGGAGKSGMLSLAAAGRVGAAHRIAVVRNDVEAQQVTEAGEAELVVVADARDPVEVARVVTQAGGPAELTVVCVDVPGCEQPAILATAEGGTVVYFSMATDFAAAALGAEGVAADVTMVIGNGYAPGHAELALDLVRSRPGVRAAFDARRSEAQTTDP